MLLKANQSVTGKSQPIRRFIFGKDRGSGQPQNLPAWDSNFSRALLYPRVIKMDSFPTRQHSVSLLSKHLKIQTPSAIKGEKKKKGLEKSILSIVKRTIPMFFSCSLGTHFFFLNTMPPRTYENMRIKDKKRWICGQISILYRWVNRLKTGTYWLLPLSPGTTMLTVPK